MDVRSKPTIQAHLRKEDVQERILQYIQKGRDEATVTISRAAELFGITENKLRDWEEYGILHPLRPGGPKGRRLYTPAELDKLAVIRELIDAGFPASDIPPDIYKQWLDIRAPQDVVNSTERLDFPIPALEHSISQRISQGRATLFWRYFVSRALRLVLLLVSEDIPNTTAGLILPMGDGVDISVIQNMDDVPLLGESLIGWLSQSRSSHTLLTPRPSFQYSSDHRLERLQTWCNGAKTDKTLILIQRDAKKLTLSDALVQTIQRLLHPIYDNIQLTRSCFGPGMCDVLAPATDLDNKTNYEDVILTGLANMVIQLGGVTETGASRWHFSCIYLPSNAHSMLALQQRSLVLQAQSDASPYTIGVTTHIPLEPFISSCIRAFQSGHSIYQPDILSHDEYTTTRPNPESTIRSRIAVPIDGYDGLAMGTLYVTSEYKSAFTDADQCILRIMGRLIQEVLETYRIRLHVSQNLRSLISNPHIVDPRFQNFLSEDNFIQHVEGLLTDIQTRMDDTLGEIISFLAVDIDNHSNLSNTYGDRIAHDLCYAVGLRIHSQLRAFKKAEYGLYHICADRFYIWLNNMTLDQARTRAESLKQTLEGSYQIEPYHAQTSHPATTDLSISIITISNLTVRLGVTSFTYQKLKEILQRYSPETAVPEVRKQIMGMFEEELAQGKRKGGNIVMSWDPALQGFVRLPR
jgi:DNA-binding transcriptional MerR regulator/GGDEF domain-containing protein